MQMKRYGNKDVKRGQGENSVPRIWNRKEVTMAELKSSGIAYKGKSTARQYTNRGSKRYSKKGRYRERHKEDI